MRTNQIIQDISDGVIVVDEKGTIKDINKCARKILHLDDKEKMINLFLDSKNDEFNQVILDSLFTKKGLTNKKINYHLNNKDTLVLNVKSSVIENKSGKYEGLVVSFDDVTNEEKLLRNRKESSIIFVVMTCILCISVFVCNIWLYLDKPVSTSFMSKAIVVCAAIIGLVMMKVLHLSKEDVGLSFENVGHIIKVDAFWTVVCLVILIVAKYIIIKVEPNSIFYCSDGKFFDFAKYPVSEYFLYAISSVAQEFASRGIVHESIKKIIDSKYSNALAIIVSSLFFGALHAHNGIIYMIGASLLLAVFGIIYDKQKSIWGLCIPHYVLGFIFGVLGFVKF